MTWMPLPVFPAGTFARGALFLLAPVAAVLWWFLAGSQPAWADVGPAGSFTTDVPIQVPSFHGLQPGLSLRYSSQAGNGWAGEGWTLDGTSVIERQSGLHGLPAWNGGDHYALDGTDLVPCAGGTARVEASPSCAHQMAGTVGYASQVENYERIAFTPGTQGGTWTVWRTDGVTVVYGPVTVTSQGVLDWRVSTVRDLSGNTVSYHWTTAAGTEPELGSISYGDVVISFKTQPRTDRITVADGAGLLALDDRLAEIDQTTAGKPVRSYGLDYTVHEGRTRESFLQSVRQYGSDGTSAYPATVYDTSAGHDVTTWQSPISPRLTALVARWPAGPADGSRWDQSLGGPDQGSLAWPNPSDDVAWLTADLNRDERQDIIEIRPNGLTLDVHVELNSDNGGYRDFDSQLTFPWPTDLHPVAGLTPAQQTINDVAGARVQLADVNSDGYPDLVISVTESTGDLVGVAFNQTPQRAVGQFAVSSAPLTHANGVIAGDVTGDGRADLIASTGYDTSCAGNAPSLTAFIGDGTGAFTRGPTTCWPAITAGWDAMPGLQVVDLNGDLKADLAGYLPANSTLKSPGTAQIFTAVSAGGGSFSTHVIDTGQAWADYTATTRCPQDSPYVPPPDGALCEVSAAQPALWGDFDGDRRTDLAVLTPGSAGTEVANVFTSNGDGTFPLNGDGTFPAAAQWSTPLPVRALHKAGAFDKYEYVPIQAPSGGVAEAPEVVRAPDRVLTDDFDGDGQTDLAVLTVKPDGTGYTSLERLINDEHSGFLATMGESSFDWQVPNCRDGPFSQCVHPQVTTGDVNADGRDDITAIVGTVGGPAATATDVTPAGPRLSGLLTGDVNGDGVTDEVSVAMASDTAVEIRTFLGTGDGRFTRVAPVTVSVADAGIKHLPADGWRLADLTGDHQADLVNLPHGARYGVLLAATSSHGWTEHLVSVTGLDRTFTEPPTGGGVTCEPKQPGVPLHCDPVSSGPPATVAEPAVLPRVGEWQIADVTGDGIPDLVHAGPGPWGTPGVLVLAGSASGTLTTEWSPSPDPAFSAALRNPLGWHLADVNGDGSADLVDADTANGRIYTLLRRGSGWAPVQQTFATTTSEPCLHPSGACTTRTAVLVEATGGDDGAWLPVDVNGDGDQDLARVVTAPLGQLDVEELISLGNGDWQPGPVTAISTTGFADFLANAADEDWHAADLDLDSRGDLVKATEYGGTLHVRMLLSDGPAGWTQAQSDVPVTAGGADDWTVQSDGGTATFTHLTNSTGDYKQDQVRSGLAPDVITGTSNGLGAATQVSYSPAAAFTATDTPASQCRLPQGAAPFVVTSIATSVQDPGLAPDAPAASETGQPATYQVQSGDTLGSISLAKLGDASLWTRIWALNDGRAEPGDTTFTDPAQIQPGWSLTLPAPSPVSPALTPTRPQTVSDSSTVRYGCARYSAPLRSFLGWADTWTTHAAATDPVTGTTGRPASIEHVTRAIDDASGIGQITLDETTDTTGTLLRRTTTSYDPAGDSPPYVNLTARTDTGDCADGTCADTSTVLTHDADGNVTSELDTAAGSGLQRDTTTAYLYDDTAWLHDQPRLTRTYAEHDGTRQLVRARMICYDGDTSSNCDTAQRPGARGLVTATRQLDGSTWMPGHTYRYDKFGNQIAATDANRHTTTTTYDAAGLFPVRTCNALSQCLTATGWNRIAEAPTRTVAITGGKTTTAYDLLGRPVRSTGPTGIVTTTRYDFTATGTTTFTEKTAGPLRHWTQTDTDGLGHVVRTLTPGSGGRPVTLETDTVYLDATLAAVQTAPYYAGQTAADWTVTSYDALGRPVATGHADGSSTPTSYGLSGGYDTTRTANEDGTDVTTRYTDGWDNLTKVAQDSVENPGQQATVTYTRNVLGQQTAVTDPHGNTETTTWNMLGEKTADNDPDLGRTTYQHDPAGNLTQTQDARGRITTMQYDPLNRLRASTDHTTGQRKTWTYGTGGGPDTGQLTAESDPSAANCPGQTSHQWRYNLLGAAVQQTQCTGGLTATITTRYNPLGQPDATTYPDNLVVRQAYDTAGKLTAIPGYVQNISYNAAGQPTAITYANHTTATNTYDPARGWLTAQNLARTSSHATLFAQSYTYDPAGLMAAVSGASSKPLAYTYDTLGELAGVTDAATGHTVQSLQYDDLGNIVTNSTVGTYTYPASRYCAATSCAGPQAATTVGPHHYTYDADGDTTTDTTADKTTHYTWTTDGMLATATSPGYRTITSTYDADDHLVQQADRAGTTTYDGGLAAHTKTGWTDYIYADGTLVADHTTRTVRWYALDYQDSTRAITDRAGHPIADTSYTAYGAPQTGPAQPRGYTSAQPVGISPLLDLQARDYDPTTGRMLSPDTITTANTAIGLNRYAYANDNPIQYTDPSGHDSTTCTDGSCLPDWASWSSFVAVSSVYALQGSAAFNSPVTQQVASAVAADSVPTKTPTAGDTSVGGGAPSAASACRNCHLIDTDELTIGSPSKVKVGDLTAPGPYDDMTLGEISDKLMADPDPEAAASRFMLEETGTLAGLPSLEEIEAQHQVTASEFDAFGMGLDLLQQHANYWIGLPGAGSGAMLAALPSGVLINSGDLAFGPVPENAWNTFDQVEATGAPFPGYRGGSTFFNRGSQGGERLPDTTESGDTISYREWDVNPYVPGVNRGAERIVTGSVNGQIVSSYYTSDHYRTFIQFFGGGQ